MAFQFTHSEEVCDGVTGVLWAEAWTGALPNKEEGLPDIMRCLADNPVVNAHTCHVLPAISLQPE